MTKVWANAEVTDLIATGLGTQNGDYYQFYYYFQVVNSGYWWIDEMQYEVNVQSLPTSAEGMPENFVRTAGATASNQSERGLVTTRKVCPSCRETVLRKSEKFGRQDESPVDDPVETWNQEF